MRKGQLWHQKPYISSSLMHSVDVVKQTHHTTTSAIWVFEDLMPL